MDIKLIKKLRSETGAGITDIREALEEAQGDERKARDKLHQQGLDKGNKKSKRETKAGMVESYVHTDKTSGAVVVLACETDFVARNEEFQKLAHELAMQVCAMSPKDIKALLSQPWIRDEKMTIGELIKSYIAKFGENIKIEACQRFEVGHGTK